MPKLQFDISNDNFDAFFASQAAGMQEAQREQLPKELLYKVFSKGFRVNTKSTRKLSFLAKLFILFKVLRKRVIILVEDEVNGMEIEDFFNWKKMIAKENYGQENSNKLITDASFVLGNKELCDTFHRLNMLSVSKSYTYLSNSKNKDYTRPQQWLEAMNYINRFVSHYEANRKRLSMQTGLTMADWLVLTHIYHGNLVDSSPIYKEVYRYCYNSSSAKVKNAFSTLQSRGFIEKIGVTKGAKIRITALGKDKVNEVMAKFVVNC
jgi:hypothetical protein